MYLVEIKLIKRSVVGGVCSVFFNYDLNEETPLWVWH